MPAFPPLRSDVVGQQFTEHCLQALAHFPAECMLSRRSARRCKSSIRTLRTTRLTDGIEIGHRESPHPQSISTAAISGWPPSHADRHRNAFLLRAPYDLVDQSQHGRMQRLIQIGHTLVHPIHGKRVLNQIVCAD